MDKLKAFLQGNDAPDEESGIMSQFGEASTFSWSTRLKGFLACFIIGVLLSLLGMFALFLHKGLPVFAMFYTLGNIASMLSTCFLMGPMNQLRKMCASTRIVATIMVLVFMALTLVAALVAHNPLSALLCFIAQSIALTWYSLSYVPYARDAVRQTFSACIG